MGVALRVAVDVLVAGVVTVKVAAGAPWPCSRRAGVEEPVAK